MDLKQRKSKEWILRLYKRRINVITCLWSLCQLRLGRFESVFMEDYFWDT